ncbi:MAG: protein kinase [Tannerellaceae bacterium]|jgi:serine/threonine-protein kinase|nr:protein kinase [Tannerellaceae bacterium]
MNLPVGHTLQNGKYQLLQVVGQGGFGITYKGVLTEIKGQLGTIRSEVPICIKEYFFKDYCFREPGESNIEIHSSMGQELFHRFKEKLLKEARILSDVHHPNIVHVLDIFEENNTAYIAMEYIEGRSLRYILEKEGILSERKVLRYIYQICQALSFVHEKNILHLDIKPSNILIDKRDNARLIDFGVSKRYDTDDKETSTTILTLSKGFAPIEQYDNEGTHIFSPCPDIYSLGATMYNVLTGKIPAESILRATRPLVPPVELNPAISRKTEKAIQKAMQIHPNDRFQTVSEMMAALDFPPDSAASAIPLPENRHIPADDATIAIPSRHPGVNSEQTIAGNQYTNWKKDRKSRRQIRKRRKLLAVSFIICIFAAVGITLLFLLGYNDAPAALTPTIGNADSTAHYDENPLPQNSTEAEVNTENNVVTPEINRQEQDMIKDTESRADNTIETVPEMNEKEKETQYLSLVTSGKSKMDKSDFAGAYDDFSGANMINPTRETQELMLISSAKKEEQQVADRLALYEEKLSFGRLMIVRKKATDKYGAIDDKGMEIIPCKYINSEPYSNGMRAFQREDNFLYDIYNQRGELRTSNVVY